MCGRYQLSEDYDNPEYNEIVKILIGRYKENMPIYKTGEIFPTDSVPVIISPNYVDILKWGFDSFNNKNKIINARYETLSQKPIFNKLLLTNRCLIPATSFFEWKTENNKKTKYKIKPKENNLFYMAGLFKEFLDNFGQKHKSFVIITTNANSQMSKIHDRMPIIMNKSEGYSWIQENHNDTYNINSKALEITEEIIDKK